MKTTSFLLLTLGFSLMCLISRGQDIATIQDVKTTDLSLVEPGSSPDFDFFGSEDVLQMTLDFNIKGFLKTKAKPEYMDATLTVRSNDTVSFSQQIKLKARGNFRCSFCSFPPIMLKFKDSDQGTRLAAGKTLKLITHCNQTPVFEDYVLKEYLVYKLFNLVAPYSFKTRLVKINYVDNTNLKKSFTAYGVLIENETMLAERNDAVIISSQNFTPKDMNTTDMTRVALFNYMIGNTDWSVQYQHNIKILMSMQEVTGKGIPVVYDFDYSGFVNTYYAAPFEELPIKTVTDRYYQGVCQGDDKLIPVLDEFDGLKDKMLGTIHDFEYLSKGYKKQAESYINSFYSMYKNRNYMISQLNSTCRQF
jgi:hypothetical protein